MNSIFDFNHESIDVIKSRYQYEIGSGNNCDINMDLYVKFRMAIRKFELPKKFKELKARIRNYKGKKTDKIKSDEQKLDKLIQEYQDMLDDAFKFNFDTDLLLTKIYSCYRNNWYEKNAKSIFKNLCKEILDNDIKKYIKYEKLIILINDNIKELFESLNI